MNNFPSSRELAEQVHIDFHRRSRRPLRRRLAWIAAAMAFLAAAWVGSKWRSGHHEVFAAGPVSVGHRMIENDCQACHTTWAPLERLMSWVDPDVIRSIDNSKCLDCHDEALHHENQVPGHGHDGLSCADCHREHRHHEQLARVTDSQCLRCHRDLKTSSGSTRAFVHSLTSFESGGEHPHPEFALKRLVQEASDGTDPGPGHGVWAVADADPKTGDGVFRDRATLRFNHAAHLKAERDTSGKLVVGLRSNDGKTVDFSKNCNACHEPDDSGAYMKPVRFDSHCRQCHPLLFDNRNNPGRQAPHVAADLVRGWFTERFTLAAVEESDGGLRTGDNRAEQTGRVFPGRADRSLLDPSQAKSVAQRVRAAEAVVQQHVHTLFGHEAKGGCRYCHLIDGSGANWKVVSPEIPDRWMSHSRFRHDSHRSMECGQCHGDVAVSRRTSDILMPSIATCRDCHAARPTNTQFARATVGARSDCVECHVYHGRDGRKRSRGPARTTLPTEDGTIRRR